ncbi:hypothetical protein LRAMOSA09916 [Lichtheimia ramosa]|uniref:Major facilitator superfamily (MFS) profile domain-containing protein n=1 Tax=Lichtheimia ramosa TaxID=688394 RepID=A0A077WMG5_9FUNG|nr:hypothetical protein LRAMOSA09916 [Lichtheimia ramosa]
MLKKDKHPATTAVVESVEEVVLKPSSVVIDPVKERKLRRKVDLRLMVWSFLASFINMLDRNNMQNAYTNGMEKDLNLNSSVYNWAVTMFFIGYVITQIPANMIITKFPPRIFLPTCVIIWGAVLCFMSIVKDHKGLLALRFCLGVAEATLYPCIVFILGTWYTKEELSKRQTLVDVGSPFAGAFGGMMGGAIAQNMQNTAGLRGWQWLFIIEGLMAVVIGLSGYLLLPSYPHNTSWLSQEERELAVARQAAQGKSIKPKPYSWKILWNVLGTPYAWIAMLIFACAFIGNTIYVNFAIILRDMGYDAAFSNYMTTPAYVFAGIVGMLIGWSSDRHADYIVHLIVLQLWVGGWYLAMALVNHGNNPAPLAFIGTYAVAPSFVTTTLSLVGVNHIFKADHNTRALAIGFINSIGMLAPNFINVRAWVVTDSPAFYAGKLTNMGMSFFSIPLVVLLWWLLRHKIMLPEATKDSKSDDDNESVTSDEQASSRYGAVHP